MSVLRDMEITAAIEARMASGEPFTFKDLWLPHGDLSYRIADRLIQKWRRAGKITYRREGRDTIWSLTDKGRAQP